ncbi:mannosyl-oligosaccharide glucosidase-like [Ptychodera flava]|uniref:mannosyl-oligosaccharide glucosidase-like n=1 Tax=Ptychodera flava TaxID=63121 RepID=UPI00396A377A
MSDSDKISMNTGDRDGEQPRDFRQSEGESMCTQDGDLLDLVEEENTGNKSGESDQDTVEQIQRVPENFSDVFFDQNVDMVRNRRAVRRASEESVGDRQADGIGDVGKYLKPGNSPPVGFRTFVLIVLIGCLPVGYFWYKHVLASRVYSPLDLPRVITEEMTNESPERYWGTYRPGVYFGMKTRTPQSMVTGMMWFTQFTRERTLPLRHTCEQSDSLPRYGWLRHDGINFGVQEIVDKNFTLMTEFVKRPGGSHGGDWTVRISGKARNKAANKTIVSLLFYAATDGQGEMEPVVEGTRMTGIEGITKELGNFVIKFPRAKNTKKSNFLRTYSPSIHIVKEVVLRSMKYYPFGQNKNMLGLVGDILSQSQFHDYAPNLLVHQITVALPFEVDIVFESGSHASRKTMLAGADFTKLLTQYSQKFDEKFESIFNLKKKGLKEKEINFAKATLSNLIGGIGYFYGKSIVKSRYTSEPVEYWDAPLYTAVPSRSFFPRGFLWDEGFHNLLISKWDPSISKEIIGHWIDLMNVEGWIPREQILGNEARAKVPAEFVVQYNENANPPTLFLPIQSLMKELVKSSDAKDQAFLKRIYPRLKVWFNWFNTTQLGNVPTSYRWRGRDATTNKELNPKTLTSGLDDYPRSSHPSDEERHVDLRCWIALASGVMADIARTIGEPHQQYQQTHDVLVDNSLLDKLHWSTKGKQYSDYGNHTDHVTLERPPSPTPMPQARGQRKPQNVPKPPMVRAIKSKNGPSYKHVNALGYVSLFPFLLEVIDPSSEKLGKILTDLKDPKLLWTKYGLRSLSKSDPLYAKYNTEHDPPYWRGQIWINMNYLTVRALHHYSSIKGPYQSLAGEIYAELRTNIITNMAKEYDRSGYVWEQYNDTTGRGQGSHPFTGWSSLVILMMAENY